MAPSPIKVSPTALRGFSLLVFMAEAKHSLPRIKRPKPMRPANHN
jgi:hypothetical protein